MKKQDQKYMFRAIELAKKGAGRVAPNPLVGCVIVKGQKILAEGYHRKYGGAHAEADALKKLKGNAKGCTLYVNLEPCHHHGKTPPCVDAVIASGVKRVVIGMRDPDPRTAGKSIRKLRRHGIQVDVGVCRKEAQVLNRFFIKHVTTGLPFVIVKVAQSRDGKITAKKGTQTWLTGRESFRYVQSLRSEVSAVLVGRKTVETDDPQLNVRNKSKPQPLRVVLGSRLSPKAKLFHTHGGDVMLLKEKSLKAALKKLAKLGVNSVLVEGGAQIFQSFLKSKHVDEWHVLTAPVELGEGALSAFKNRNVRFGKISCSSNLGKDHLVIYSN